MAIFVLCARLSAFSPSCCWPPAAPGRHARSPSPKTTRVEAFALDIWEDGWREVARGTNIGHRRILRFPEQNAVRLRIRILSARAKPHISRVAAYLDAPSAR